MSDLALSLTLDGTPDLPSAPLQALYRITGRSTVELREAILSGRPVYTVGLFGGDHIHVVPRFEKTLAFLIEHGLAFTVTESHDGEDATISLDTMREILEAPTGDDRGDSA